MLLKCLIPKPINRDAPRIGSAIGKILPMIPVIEVPISVKDVVMALSTEAMLPPADSEANTGTQDATAAPAPATTPFTH